MIRLIKPSALLILGLCIVLNLSAQEKKDYKKLHKYIETAVDSFDLPGLAVGIIRNNEVVFLKSYGYRNTETMEKIDEHSIFGIASCSKAFTAACLAILVDEGKLKWDDRVVSHYPGFQLYDPYITRELMIKDLLCHRAGYLTFDGDLLWYGTDYSREEVVSRFRYRENEFSLREKFGYSNLMYIAAGEVIYHVTGKTWEEFVKEKIFNPLGMETTTTSNSGFTKNMNIAWPHIDGKPEGFINYDNSGPAASINTSSSELLKWVQLMLNKGAWNDTTVFSEKQYYNLVKPQSMLNSGKANIPNDTHFNTYALGWFVKDYAGMKVIDHGGGLPGFHSQVVFVPEDSLGYIILANEISLLVPALERDLLDFHLNDSLGWATRYLPYKAMQKERVAKKVAKMEESRTKNTEPSLALESYTGTYEDKMYGRAEISMKDGNLFVELLPAKKLFHSTMEHWHYNTFKIKFNDPFLPEGFVTFHLDEKGEITSFKIDLENPDFHFYKLDFTKL
jgi:CubicO group peptidase (beta-lactamase class C family)